MTAHLIKLPRTFYLRPTLRVARELLGKYLVRKTAAGTLIGRIVEVEAYLGEQDPASHAHRGRSPRNGSMFLGGGHLYVYFTYGMHHCCNVVTEREGLGRAVLIRAIEPVRGIPVMLRNRKRNGAPAAGLTGSRFTGGPARVCQAMGITASDDGADLLGGSLFICGLRRGPGRIPLPMTSGEFSLATVPVRIKRSARVGITRARGKMWRYYIANNSFVSAPM